MGKSVDKTTAGTVLTLIAAVYYLLIAVVDGGGLPNGNASLDAPPTPWEQFTTPENVVVSAKDKDIDTNQILEPLYIGFLAGYSHSKVINWYFAPNGLGDKGDLIYCDRVFSGTIDGTDWNWFEDSVYGIKRCLQDFMAHYLEGVINDKRMNIVEDKKTPRRQTMLKIMRVEI